MLLLGHYQQLLDLSERMLDAAQRLQWEEVKMLEDERADLIKTIKILPGAPADRQAIKEHIEQILRCDEEITTYVSPAHVAIKRLLAAQPKTPENSSE